MCWAAGSDGIDEHSLLPVAALGIRKLQREKELGYRGKRVRGSPRARMSGRGSPGGTGSTPSRQCGGCRSSVTQAGVLGNKGLIEEGTGGFWKAMRS